MTTDDLKRLRRDAEKIVRRIYERRDGFVILEPINWGSLHCVQANFVQTSDGISYYEVEIEEASPGGCPKLCEMVGEGLAAAGWPDVQVRTEW